MRKKKTKNKNKKQKTKKNEKKTNQLKKGWFVFRTYSMIRLG